jgi:hypothetical protein
MRRFNIEIKGKEISCFFGNTRRRKIIIAPGVVGWVIGNQSRMEMNMLLVRNYLQKSFYA